MPTTLILLNTPVNIVDGAAVAVATSATFALPTGQLSGTWERLFAVNPGTFTAALQISIDGTNWTTLLDASGTVSVITQFGATTFSGKFIRLNVTAVAGGTTYIFRLNLTRIGSGT